MEGSMASLFSRAVWTTLFASLPILGAALVVGLAIGILQTATSIQEQTLSFVPKILAVLLTTLLLGPTIFHQVVVLARDVFGNLDAFVK
ncbi:MAG: flagellar biosynthetic protein FliQ [Synergistales bacterium]